MAHATVRVFSEIGFQYDAVEPQVQSSLYSRRFLKAPSSAHQLENQCVLYYIKTDLKAPMLCLSGPIASLCAFDRMLFPSSSVLSIWSRRRPKSAINSS